MEITPSVGWRRNLAWAAFYLVVSVLRLAPLSVHASTRLADDGDAMLAGWILWWGSHHLVDGRFFEANAHFPHGSALLYAEPLIGQALVSWPLFRAFEVPLALNILTVLTFAASAFAMHLLLRRWTGSDAAAVVGAFVFAFNAYAMWRVPRIQLVSLQWMPLTLLCLDEFARRGRWRWATAFAFSFLMHGLSCLYYLVFFAVALVVVAPAVAWNEQGWRTRRALAGLTAACALAAVPLLLLASRMSTLYRQLGFEAATRPFDLGLYLLPLPENPWYGSWGKLLRGVHPDFFLGFVAIALAAVGLFAASREARRARWVGLAVAGLIALVLSAGYRVVAFGVDVGPGPLELLRGVPPFGHMREPRRFAVIVILVLAVFAARGAAALLARAGGPLRPALAAVLPLVVLLEPLAPSRTTGIEVPAGHTVPDAYRWVARHGDGPVVEVPAWPLTRQRLMALDQYLSTFHGQPIPTGWASFPPPALERLTWSLRGFPDELSLAVVRSLGFRHLIVHPHRWPDDERRARLKRLRGRDDVLPVLSSFPPGTHASWIRYGLGEEEVRGVAPAAEVAPLDCACAPVPRDAFAVSASRGHAARAVDGTSLPWTTGARQRRGDWLELAFERPVNVGRIEIDMAHPYGEFAQSLQVVGFDTEDREIVLGPVSDPGYEVALLRRLSTRPAGARLRYSLQPTLVQRVRLRLGDEVPGAPAWTVPEVHVFEAVPAGSPH